MLHYKVKGKTRAASGAHVDTAKQHATKANSVWDKTRENEHRCGKEMDAGCCTRDVETPVRNMHNIRVVKSLSK